MANHQIFSLTNFQKKTQLLASDTHSAGREDR
jgi:hypothetical protein